MKLPLYILAFIWLLPATIITWLFYILPLLIFRSIKFCEWCSYIPVFTLINDDSWYAKKWKDWYGWSGPWVIILKDLPLPGSEDDSWVDKTLTHEFRHCMQQMILGLFFYPVYILNSIFIWFFIKSKHAYLDNFFERDARTAANQRVDIPMNMWPHGSSDRWPWW
jgi:hypothetical protein